MLKLLSVNLSLPQTVDIKGKPVSTGIYKRPVAGPVWLRRTKLDGDGQADLENHGGVDKAAYAYPWEHYAHWSHELGRNNFEYGQFGENFTTEGLSEKAVSIGDQLRIGKALVEVSQPRVPCFKLAHKMGLPEFPKQFLASRRSGFYLRVLEEGEVQAGDSIERVKFGQPEVTIEEVVNLFFFERKNAELMQRLMANPALTPSWREELAQRMLPVSP